MFPDSALDEKSLVKKVCRNALTDAGLCAR